MKLVIETVMKSDAGIEASRVMTYSRAAPPADAPSAGDAKVSLVFMASALRPASPYAEPDVRVDYVHKAADPKVNNSVIQQVSYSNL